MRAARARAHAMDGALALQKGALRARFAERKTEKEKLKEEREREKQREQGARARSAVRERET